MKKIIFVALTLFVAGFQKMTAQDSTQQIQLTQLLSHYYGVKDALVDGNSANASLKATAFIKNVNSIDYKLISEGNINALLKDATVISETKELKVQREHFVNFSNNMAVLAKGVKLTSQTVYLDYCPMKKANWLSSEKDIKNPP